jgi:hypothetical protein
MASVKLKIIAEAEQQGNRAAGHKCDVMESCIRNWRKIKSLLLQSSESHWAFHGQQPKFPQIEAELCKWYIRCT